MPPAAAAHWATGNAQIDPNSLPTLLPSVPNTDARIYLAGPFFTAAERWLIEQAREGLLDLGVGVFSPLHDVGLGGDEVARDDLEGLKTSDGVLALLDGADPGTLFEIGWARHAGVPVVAFSASPDSSHWTMLRGTNCEVLHDFPTAAYRAGWAAMQHVGEGS